MNLIELIKELCKSRGFIYVRYGVFYAAVKDGVYHCFDTPERLYEYLKNNS